MAKNALFRHNLPDLIKITDVKVVRLKSDLHYNVHFIPILLIESLGYNLSGRTLMHALYYIGL